MRIRQAVAPTDQPSPCSVPNRYAASAVARVVLVVAVDASVLDTRRCWRPIGPHCERPSSAPACRYRGTPTIGAKAVSSQLSPYITRNSGPSGEGFAQRAAGSEQIRAIVAIIDGNAELAAILDKSLDLLAEIADAKYDASNAFASHQPDLMGDERLARHLDHRLRHLLGCAAAAWSQGRPPRMQEDGILVIADERLGPFEVELNRTSSSPSRALRARTRFLSSV